MIYDMIEEQDRLFNDLVKKKGKKKKIKVIIQRGASQ